MPLFRRRAKPREIRFGTCRLVYQEYGSGPPLVLIHGLVGSANWWKRNIPVFTQHFTVYVIDLVGFGSNRSLRPLRIQKTADCLSEFIAHLPAGRAHVVGHSMGGQIATHLAGQYPERVERLVLAAASGLVRADLIRMALRLPQTGRYGQLDFAPTLFYDTLRAGPVSLLLGALDILSNDVTTALTNIVAPTLLIWGSHDKLVPLGVGEAVQQAVRGAQLEVIAGAGHVLMWDRPEQFNQLVLDFLLTQGEQQPPNDDPGSST